MMVSFFDAGCGDSGGGAHDVVGGEGAKLNFRFGLNDCSALVEFRYGACSAFSNVF